MALISQPLNKLEGIEIPQARSNIAKAFQATNSSLLILTVIASAIATIPPLRFAGSLVARSITLLSSSIHCVDQFSSNGKFDRCLSVAKLAISVFGIVAIAASFPVFIIASLATEYCSSIN